MKADGLAAGKGVVVAGTEAEAREALEACLVDGRLRRRPGSAVVVEEGLTGPEVSLLAISDGRALARFPAARDYKPIGEGNTGPNTGGMGSVSPGARTSPTRWPTSCSTGSTGPWSRRWRAAARPFSGVLYAGLMMTAGRPAGARVQHPLRRPRDPGAAAALGGRRAGRADGGGRGATWRTGRCA